MESDTFDLDAVQAAIRQFGFDGWLLYDFRGSNILALRILGIQPNDVGSRRLMYFVPATGTPQKLVHRIESGALDHLPGDKLVYLRWQEFEESIGTLIADRSKIAMEYSPRNSVPYISKVDAGIIEIVTGYGSDVLSSGNLIQFFEARWTAEQWESHLEADRLNQQAFGMAWKSICDTVSRNESVREFEIQSQMMQFFADHGMTTYHPPIVAVNEHSGDPHYAPVEGSDGEIRSGDFVLIDSWAKMDRPGAVYSDLTKVAFLDDAIPDRHDEIFRIVAAGRDAGIQLVRDAFSSGDDLFGWQVDDAVRNVIEQAGYGEFFIHRTGHNIGQETHGNGANIDNLETREDRMIMPRTCFSIEPGIYLPEFGVRSEVDVYVDEHSEVHVTGGLQNEILLLPC